MLLEEMVADIQTEFPEPLESVVIRALKRTLSDFYRRTEAWRVQDTISGTGGNVYYLSPPDGTYPMAVRRARAVIDGHEGTLQYVTPDLLGSGRSRPTELTLNEDFVEVDTVDPFDELKVWYVVVPQMAIEEVPDEIAIKHFDFIRAGAVYHMLCTPGQPWQVNSTVNDKNYYLAAFENGIVQARREARQDRSRPARKVRYGGIPL